MTCIFYALGDFLDKLLYGAWYSNEQQLYFDLNQFELDIMGQFGTIKTKVYFILQLAYFKAKNQFFTFTFDDVRADVEYVLAKFFKKTDAVFQGSITRKRINQQKQIILNLFEYQNWSVEQAIQVKTHLCELLRYYPKAHDTFRQLLVYFDNQKIVIPTYRNLQDMFTQAFANEGLRLNQLILLIPLRQQEQLSELINREDSITKPNIIRADQKNFTYTAISAEEDQFPALAQFLQGSTFDTTAAMREFYLKSSRLFALYLRPILQTLTLIW
ncbi:MAG: DUF4158 domain-containing protein [Legionellales bacterium]